MSNGVVDATLELPDGRTLGYADFGADGGRVVLWCHGGPGSRLEPKFLAGAAAERGFRIVGIDRPGYGLSTPRPGRSIEAFVPDLLAVADAVGADRFVTVGCSTGAAYALAAAAIAADRVDGSVVVCGLTDMSFEPAKQAMVDNSPEIGRIWNATSRDDAMALAAEQFGEDGSKLFSVAEPSAGESESSPRLADADTALFADAQYLSGLLDSLPPMFAQGVQGYVDDRLADGTGWTGFEVSTISCPVIVAHGEDDTIVPVETARHTAEVVPGAKWRAFPGEGHLSMVRHAVDLLSELR